MAYTPYNPYMNPYQYSVVNQPMQQQQTQQNMFQPVQPAQQNNQGLIWVQGEVGAKSYLVAPNSTVMLMDSESSKFFIKSTDGAGMPTIRTYEYKECVQNVTQDVQSNSIDMSEEYVTRKEYETLSNKYDSLFAKIEELQKPKVSSKKKEVVGNE